MDRLSANALLRSVIAVMAAAVVLVLTVADASGNAFEAMHNLRTDRSSSARLVNAEATITPEMDKYVHGIQGAEMPALNAAVALLDTVDFADKATLLPQLQHSAQSLASMQKEFWDAVEKPKAQRRLALADEYFTEATAAMEELDKGSQRLFAAVKHTDPVIDQLFELKQIAWLVRNTGGDASLLISQGTAAGKLPPEARDKYLGFVGGSVTGWAALEDMASGTVLPQRVADAIAAAKQSYFAADYTAKRPWRFRWRRGRRS